MGFLERRKELVTDFGSTGLLVGAGFEFFLRLLEPAAFLSVGDAQFLIEIRDRLRLFLWLKKIGVFWRVAKREIYILFVVFWQGVN